MNSGNALVIAAERARQVQAVLRAADSVRSSGGSPSAVEGFPILVRSRSGVYGQDASVEFTRNPSCLGSCEVDGSVLPGFSVHTVTATQRGAPSGEVHVSVLRASR